MYITPLLIMSQRGEVTPWDINSWDIIVDLPPPLGTLNWVMCILLKC